MRKGRHEFKRVIIVTGTPGVGKTIVSEQLATKLRAQHVDLAEIVKRERLTSGYDKKRQTWIADTSRLAKRLQQKIKQEKTDVIIDGHFASAVIPKAQVTRVFVLRRHPQQLKEQMERRGYKGAKLWENLASEVQVGLPRTPQKLRHSSSLNTPKVHHRSLPWQRKTP